MELTFFLDPVELERPDAYYLKSKELFSKSIVINTGNEALGDLSNYQLAILGVPEDRNSYNKGAGQSPDKIRAELYKLIVPGHKVKIIDLGNIKPGNTYNDTYVALKEVIYTLLGNNLNIVLIGGTQELTLPVFQAFENYQERINLVTIDSRIDANKAALETDSDSYLLEILLKKSKLFRFAHLGHQACFTERQNIELINKLFHDIYRLGEIRADLLKIEPCLRDTDIVSFDMGSIRQADSPGNFRPSPNGFYAEEACQISRYAGTSDQVRLFGLFEANQRFDPNNHTAALAAQMIWYYIEGLEIKTIEKPDSENANFKTFIVGHSDLNSDMIFYRSMLTDRWWLEVPDLKSGKPALVSCSYEDYQTACNNEVPEIWWKTFQKIG